MADPTSGRAPDELEGRTESGLPFEPLYGPEPLAGLGPGGRAGRARASTRSPAASTRRMYTGRPWTMRQYAGFGTAKESNERYHAARRGGHRRAVRRLRPAHADGLRLRRRRSRTARSARSAWPSTRSTTCACCSTGIPLDQVSTSMTINAPGVGAAAALPAGRRGAGRRPGEAHRHDPERRAQGVHRPRHLHLPAEGSRCG